MRSAMTQQHRTRVQPANLVPMANLGRGLLIGLALFAASCADDEDPVSQLRTPTQARFSPSAGEIPIPNDLLYSGSVDGTLNLPIEDPAVTSDPFIALNTLDGWSPVAPANVSFTRNLDPTTVIPGDTVRMFEVTVSTAAGPVGGPVTAIDRELIAGLDFVAVVANDSDVAIQPLVPLTPSTASDPSVYMIVLTNGISDTSGVAVDKDTEYLFASEETPFPPATTPPQLLQLQALVGAQLTAFAGEANAVREDVVVSFTFTVQSVGSSLGPILTVAQGNEGALLNSLCAQLGTCGTDTTPDPLSTADLRVNAGGLSIGTASELTGGAPGIADIFVGVFEAPYYLTEANNTTADFAGLTNDATPLSASWTPRYETAAGATGSQLSRLNPLPVVTSSQRMPLLVSVPQGAVPPDGFPIVIFQHGIGGNRTALLGIAEALAADGLAAIAIDLPLHGVNETTGMLAGGVNIFSGFRQETMGSAADSWERTFGMDVLTEPVGGIASPGPDMNADSSGVHFINLSNLAVSRDNIRQGVSDLFNLKESLGLLTVMGADMFDEDEVHYIGHSLGAIVGTPFLALQPNITTATLGMPGSSIPYLLNASTVFGPVVQGGLSGAGLTPGTPQYAQFLAAAQTILDSADPINYAGTIAALPTPLPLLLIEVIGGGPQGGVADLVIPNSVVGAPFAGTEPLIAALGLASLTGNTADAGGIRGAVRFVEGNHGSLLTPTDVANPGLLAAFLEMQAQVRSFHVSDGQNFTVSDTTVIQQ